MNYVTVKFTYQGETLEIECSRDEYIKDIIKKYFTKLQKEIKDAFYLYNGTTVDQELKLEQINKKDSMINILVESPENLDKKIIQKYSDDIICPQCGEICFININDYKINLNKCKNNHYDDLLLNEFKEKQKIDESKILCNDCKKFNKSNTIKNKFFKCCTCKKNICLLCQNQNHKEHIVIDYDNKNYFCEFHGEKYNYFCKECNINLCNMCEHDNKHELIYFKKIIRNKNELIETNKILKENIDKLKKDINEIIMKLNKVIDNLETYYNITNNAINNYDIKYINYQSLTNMKNINNSDLKIIDDINQIINENLIENKIKYINKIYGKLFINEMIINYKINEGDEKIRIFGDNFIKNNKDNYKIIINNREYELKTHLNIKDFEIKNNILEIKLREINPVNNLFCMFSECSCLFSLKDISKFNIDNVTSLFGMFEQCSSLISLPDDISNWNTNNVTNISLMFSECSSLKSLPDISKWTTDRINNMKATFQTCSSLKSLPDISKWNIDNVTDISFLFNKCSSLISLPDISKWNTNNVNNISYIFSKCSSLKSLPDISKWTTDKINNMSTTFQTCSEYK